MTATAEADFRQAMMTALRLLQIYGATEDGVALASDALRIALEKHPEERP